MQTDELYRKWCASKRSVDLPDGWADRAMQRIGTYETSRQSWPGPQACMAWLSTCLPARFALVLAGSLACVARVVVLFLAILG